GYPLQQPGLGFMQERFKNLAQEAENVRKDCLNLASQLDEAKHLSCALREEARRFQDLNAEAERRIESLQEENSRKEKLTEELLQRHEITQSEAISLRQELDQQKQRISGLTAQVEVLLTREKDLRQMLLDAHDQL